MPQISVLSSFKFSQPTFTRCLFFLFILYVNPAYAQQDSAINIMKPAVFDSTGKAAFKDSLPAPAPPKGKKKGYPFPTSFINQNTINHNGEWRVIDTLTDRNEIYHPMYYRYGIFQDLGNMGTAGQPLLFGFNRKVDFVLCLNPWETYHYKPEDTRYYNTKIPYTDITYVQGEKELIYLKLTHAQNITPRWNIGVDYFRLSSDGFYPRQKTSLFATRAFTRYQSMNKRYDLLVNMIWNYNLAEENGGLASDSAFEALSGSTKSGFVNLNASQSRVKNRIFFAKQYFHFGKKTMDIKDDDTLYDFNSWGHFSHTFRAEDISYIFESFGDPVSSLLPQRYYSLNDSLLDSMYHGQLSNRLAYTMYNSRNPKEQRYLEIGFAHKIIEVNQHSLHAVFNNVVADGTLERQSSTDNSLSLRLYGSYCMLGYNQNDLRLEGDIRFQTKFFNITGGAYNHLLTPDFTFMYFSSNAFTWNNSFSKMNVSNWHVNLQTRTFANNANITFHQYLLANWVYFNADARPAYSDDVIVLQTLEARKTFQIWKKVFLDNKVIFQKANNDIIRVPDFGAVLRYYFQAYLFKKALKYQLGVDVFYNTSFRGNAYNPATRGFYLQDKFIGNYPLINPFVTGEIRKAIIFVAVEHLNESWLSPGGFYNVPHYPLPVRVFRAGVRWRMYN